MKHIVYQHLKEIRLERGLTLRQAAAVIHVSPGTYSRYERRGGIRVHHIEMLADYYGTSTDYLLDLTDRKEPHPRAPGYRPP
ncbi:helix-turn-helix transcriptional regulator [uncultured Anaerotruncus sp.]|uniref:helix-turn-helix domain-containing protein n=1 Tax=uncultured Anaerotruncus sp. TaxID=905011 RepID=UPI00280ABA5F|nr:helix-turn-helix transcriptional regulator [uncultured Anaerotruncus sp.]